MVYQNHEENPRSRSGRSQSIRHRLRGKARTATKNLRSSRSPSIATHRYAVVFTLTHRFSSEIVGNTLQVPAVGGLWRWAWSLFLEYGPCPMRPISHEWSSSYR